MTRTITAAGLAVLLLCGLRGSSQSEGDPGAGGRAGKLVGTYAIVSGEKDGMETPDQRVKGTTVRITEDAIVVTDKDSKQTYAATYKLDTGKKPWTITMTSAASPEKGQTVRGLVERKGDTIRLIYALPGGTVPTSFKTKEKQMMFILKEMKKSG